MADLFRRSAAAAMALSLLILAWSGSPRAAVIMVNTTDGGSQPAPLCTLPDAVDAHNTHSAINGCTAGSINDVIKFLVTGTISIEEPLEVASGALEIHGPSDGCGGVGPCGVSIDGHGSVQILIADTTTVVTLSALTLTNGFAVTTAPGTG